LEQKLEVQTYQALRLSGELAECQKRLRDLCSTLSSLATDNCDAAPDDTPDAAPDDVSTNLTLNVAIEGKFLGCYVLPTPPTHPVHLVGAARNKQLACVHLSDLHAWVADRVKALPGMQDHPAANDDMRICFKQQQQQTSKSSCTSTDILTSQALTSQALTLTSSVLAELFGSSKTVDLDVSAGTFFADINTSFEAALANQPRLAAHNKCLGAYLDWSAAIRQHALSYTAAGLRSLQGRWSLLALAWRSKLFDRLLAVDVETSYSAWFVPSHEDCSTICQAALDVMDYVGQSDCSAQALARHLRSALTTIDILRLCKAQLKSGTLLSLVAKFFNDRLVMLCLTPLVYTLQLAGSGKELADIVQHCLEQAGTHVWLATTGMYLVEHVLVEQHCCDELRRDFVAHVTASGFVDKLKQTVGNCPAYYDTTRALKMLSSAVSAS
jgi:hypothetical protein